MCGFDSHVLGLFDISGPVCLGPLEMDATLLRIYSLIKRRGCTITVFFLKLIHCESIEVHSENGWHRVAFQESVLGWIKVIGNRVNNYYPKEWRVKLKE